MNEIHGQYRVFVYDTFCGENHNRRVTAELITGHKWAQMELAKRVLGDVPRVIPASRAV